MKANIRILCYAVALWSIVLRAQLAVTVAPPKAIGQKAIVKLTMTNSFKVRIESARAALFLLDENGGMVGQASKWVIGGTKDRAVLEPGQEATFNFVVQANRPFTSTNLTANINFTRLALDGGQQIDPVKNVTMSPLKKGLKK